MVVNLKGLMFFLSVTVNGNKLNQFLIFTGVPEKTNKKRFSQIKELKQKKIFMIFVKKKLG